MSIESARSRAYQAIAACTTDLGGDVLLSDFTDSAVWDSLRLIELSFCLEELTGTAAHPEVLRSLTDFDSLVLLLLALSD